MLHLPIPWMMHPGSRCDHLGNCGSFWMNERNLYLKKMVGHIPTYEKWWPGISYLNIRIKCIYIYINIWFSKQQTKNSGCNMANPCNSSHVQRGGNFNKFELCFSPTSKLWVFFLREKWGGGYNLFKKHLTNPWQKCCFRWCQTNFFSIKRLGSASNMVVNLFIALIWLFCSFGCFRKYGFFPQIIHFNRGFPWTKTSILGYLCFLETSKFPPP